MYIMVSFRYESVIPKKKFCPLTPPPNHKSVPTTSCFARPSAIPSVTILKIGGNRRLSYHFEHDQKFLRDCVFFKKKHSQEINCGIEIYL